jgi:hypothetical protein
LRRGDLATGESQAGGPEPLQPDGQRHRTVREIAEALQDQGLGSPQLSLALMRVIQAEERVFAEQADLALLEAQITETDQALDERMARLRYAAMQVSQERARPRGPAGPKITRTLHPTPSLRGTATLEPALEAHLAEVEQRMAELDRERRLRVEVLERNAAAHRAALVKWNDYYAAEMGTLEQLVVDARPSVTDHELRRLYGWLDKASRRTRPCGSS